MEKVLVSKYNPEEISLLDSEMKSKWTIFKAELMKAILDLKNDKWIWLDAKWIIDFYYDITQNAMTVNSKTGELIPDYRERRSAMNELKKIMTDNWKWNININIQNNTNIWDNMPKPEANLIY